MNDRLTAVVWDFDGTLVDTREKNLNVTRALVELVRGVPGDQFDALNSLADYERALRRHGHWTDFYRIELGMSASEVDHAGGLWAAAQLEDTTLPISYDGIGEVLRALDHLPHGIVSLNARDNILRLISALELGHHFDVVIGYEAFEPARHKPAPDALLACIDRLTGSTAGKVLYVGDHETDAQSVHAANDHYRQLGLAIEVLSVSAVFGPHADDSDWNVRPHFRAERPGQIVEFARRLGAVVS